MPDPPCRTRRSTSTVETRFKRLWFELIPRPCSEGLLRQRQIANHLLRHSHRTKMTPMQHSSEASVQERPSSSLKRSLSSRSENLSAQIFEKRTKYAGDEDVEVHSFSSDTVPYQSPRPALRVAKRRYGQFQAAESEKANSATSQVSKYP